MLYVNVCTSASQSLSSLRARSDHDPALLKCPYVRTSVRPQSFFDFNEIWHVGRGRCSITRSKVKVISASKLEILPFLKAVSSAIYNESCN